MSSPEIPALPPPLPTHSRSLSYSSSSSSAGSPAQQSGPFAQNTVRRKDSKGSPPLSRSGSQGFGGANKWSESVSSSSPPLSRSSSFVRQGSNSPASQRSATSIRRSPSTSNSPDPSSSTSRHRASSILNKVSPSLSQTRYASSSPNTSSVGLRNANSLNSSSKPRREPLGLGLGLGAGAFSRGMGQLPSPPHTSSDGASNASNTIRSRDGLGSEHGSGGSTELKSERPERPPKSEARVSLSTPPKRRTLPFDVPSIERSSPTVAGSPARRASLDRSLPGDGSTSSASATAEASLRRSLTAQTSIRQSSGFDDPASPNSPTPGSPRASLVVDLNSSAGSESDASARTARDDGDVKGKGRAREASLEALEGTARAREDGQDRRTRRASELRVKNQKIVDSINSAVALVSPPRSQDGFQDDVSLVHRASTSTLRSPSTNGTTASPTTFTHPRESSRNADPLEPASNDRRSSLERTVRPSSSTVDEFGSSIDGGSVRRSSTMSAVASDERDERDRERRVRTLGSARRCGPDELPERSYTSMSTYSPASAAHPRRSELVGSERTRAASALGDNADRDREMMGGIRRTTSRDMSNGIGLDSTSPRVRRRASEAGLLLDRAQKTELPDSPAVSNSISPSIRQRPRIPLDFLSSPPTNSPSTSRRSPRPDFDASSPRTNSPRIQSPSLRERVQSPRTHSPRTASPLSTPDPDRLPSNATAAERRRQSQSEGITTYAGRGESVDYDAMGLPHARPPRAGRAAKSSGGSGSTGSGGGITSPGRPQWREDVISEEEGSGSKAASRLEGRRRSRAEEREDVFRNGLNQLNSPGERSLSRADSRYSSIADNLEARKEKLRSTEVGSEAWMAEFQDLRRRSARSRASGSSGDARSAMDVPSSLAGHLERDRTVRAINALYNGEESPRSPSSDQSSPRKRHSGQFNSQRSRRISFANSTHDSSAANSPSMVRSNSASTSTSRSGASSRLSSYRNGGDHHALLYSAFERFEQYFASLDGQEAPSPESIDLVKRMAALIGSTTKLNSGLRSLLASTSEAQVEAELDEGSRSPTVGIAQFEKSVNSLLRTSDDQVRCLTEDLIAFTRVERERDRLRQNGDGFSRPASRASSYRGGPLHASPKRPATSSPFEGATVSMSSGRSVPSSASRQTLRDPLAEEDGVPRRHTMSLSSSRGQYIAADSPTPGSRRETAPLRSPLSSMDDFAPRRTSISSAASSQPPTTPSAPSVSEMGLPSASASSADRLSLRRAKGSSTSTATVRPVTPTHRFPTTSTSPDAPVVDSTPATTLNSPTRQRVLPTAIPFPRSNDRQYRTYSEADRLSLDSLSLSGSQNDGSSYGSSTSPEQGRPAKERMSTGSQGLGKNVGAAIRSLTGLKSRRDASEGSYVREEGREEKGGGGDPSPVQ
ncbi:hypothetical protein BCR35DRAFT_332882 [Leucosporidium creatinivorum]|uniref:Uncharacterized protein n=1 Tax=Leucosporidium creatinivorum TaxID=106004 RepID=A0A1Y2EXE0_9BASI|nr:hypothetical protein BCR35DRAFT_332882 [Leucosporidium creatinivorum]